LDHEVVKSVANTNFKVVADLPAVLSGQMVQNALNHQVRLQTMSEAALGAAIRGINEVDPAEARSLKELFTGNAVAEQISSLGASIAALQELIKAAQTTPPSTG
jgi:hypothetical protein